MKCSTYFSSGILTLKLYGDVLLVYSKVAAAKQSPYKLKPHQTKSHFRVSKAEARRTHRTPSPPAYLSPCALTTMSMSESARVEKALQQLLERLVPQYPDEDEATADQRWEEANELARDHIDRDAEPGVVEDVNHAADLIRRKLLREANGPESTAVFSNLYSRLLSQPVLGQKWGILYFLLRVAEGKQEEDANGGGAVGEGVEDKGEAHGVGDEDDQVYNEAFARNGITAYARR